MSKFNRDNSHGCSCKGCEDRYPGCHDKCENYKAWKKKHDEAKKAERTYHQSNDIISERKKRAIWKNQRYSRKLWRNRAGLD